MFFIAGSGDVRHAEALRGERPYPDREERSDSMLRRSHRQGIGGVWAARAVDAPAARSNRTAQKQRRIPIRPVISALVPLFIGRPPEFRRQKDQGLIEIELRRVSELAARLTISSNALMLDDDQGSEQDQFRRVIGGLARQLRSPLDEKIGRLSVDIPVFPD